MNSIYDFNPKFCPNCGRSATHRNGHHGGCQYELRQSFSCICGNRYQRATTQSLLEAAKDGEGDLDQKAVKTTEQALKNISQDHQGGAQIFLVEDDVAISSAVQELLDLEGYTFYVAYNGQEALDKLKKIAPPQLILLDLMMPVLNGFELLQIKNRDKRLAGIPVVVMSAVAETAKNATGVNEVLRKPMNIDELLKVCERYCRDTEVGLAG